MASRKFLTDIDMVLNEILNLVLQNLAADPGSGTAGQVYYNTTANEPRYYDGTVWTSFGSSETAASILAKLITVDGTGSGLDADLLDGLDSTAFATAVHNHVSTDVTDFTAAVQSIIDTYVIDGAGAALDTLNELAAALGDDPNFSVTITNLINSKVDSASFVNSTTAAAQVFLHNLGNTEAVVQVIEVSTGEVVEPCIRRDSLNQHTVEFSPAPSIGQFEIIVHA